VVGIWWTAVKAGEDVAEDPVEIGRIAARQDERKGSAEVEKKSRSQNRVSAGEVKLEQGWKTHQPGVGDGGGKEKPGMIWQNCALLTGQALLPTLKPESVISQHYFVTTNVYHQKQLNAPWQFRQN